MNDFQSKWNQFWKLVAVIALAIATVAGALGGVNFIQLTEMQSDIIEVQENNIPTIDKTEISAQTQSAGVYKTPGSNELVIASGGTLTVESGGIVDMESGAISNWECGTTATFTDTLTLTPTLLSTVNHVVATQVTVPAATAALLYVSDASGANITIKSIESDYTVGTTGITAEYCLYGTP
jgi:hypothetical protein